MPWIKIPEPSDELFRSSSCDCPRVRTFGGVYFVSFYMILLRRGTTETFRKLSVVARKRSVVKWLEPCPWLNCSSYRKQKWWQTYTWLFDVILRLSDALVCFRASGANFLRSITRAIVNKNDGKRIIDFLTLFWNFQKLSFVFAPLGLTSCALSPGL